MARKLPLKLPVVTRSRRPGLYTTVEVARLLGMSEGQIRGFVRAGFLRPSRGARGAMEFSFHELVLLRTAKALTAARITPRRIKAALKKLQAQLPEGRPLTAVSIAAEGRRIVVRDGDQAWHPESGQSLFAFAVRDLAKKVAPLAAKSERRAKAAETTLRAEDWYALGYELELSDPAKARDAYRRAVELMPGHVDAHTNLGRLLHEAGELEAALAHYRLALAADADHATAAYNMGVVLEDLGRLAEAVRAYEQALASDRALADAHHNLARIYEQQRKPQLALRHLHAYQRLIADEF